MKTSVTGAWLTVNRSCNNRCDWCYAKSTGFNKNDMSFSLAQQIITFLEEIEIKNVIIIGGEPTVYPHLSKVIKELNDRNINSHLITNGRKFANKAFTKRIVKSGIKKITFSAKGANPQHYKKLTGVDGYSEMINGARNLQDSGINVPFSITIVNDLIPHIFELLDNLLNEKIKNISFDMGSPIILNNKISADGIPNPQELADICIKIHNFLKAKKVEYGFRISIPLCLLPEKEREEILTAKRIATCCHLQKGKGLIFDQEGNILPCNHFPLHPLCKFLRDFNNAETFQNLWKGTDVQKFRMLTRRYPSKKCQKCSNWDICGGGCFVKWGSMSKSVYRKYRYQWNQT